MLTKYSLLVVLSLAVCASATVFEVGPDREFERIIDCPTFALQSGDSVLVHFREEPYRDKFLLHGVGSEEAPIVLLGIPDSLGRKPIIDGQDAETSRDYAFWNEVRQVALVGLYQPLFSDWIIIEGFEIRNANDHHSFVDDHGERFTYAENACAIRAEYCGHLTIRNCDLHHCANGFQNGSTDRQQFVTLEGCHIFDNGADVDSTRYLEHNIYLGGEGVHATIQFCWFGELLNDGQQLKSRAETNIIRYNWIEGGRNSQLDLVDSGNDDLIANAWVYGNVIIKPDSTHNSRFIHFGGDQEGHQRRGALHFFNNTCIINSTRNYGTRRLFEITRDSARVIADNNIFFLRDNAYAVWNGFPNITGANNWLSEAAQADSMFTNNLRGVDPGFVNAEDFDFHLRQDSPCIDAARDYAFPEGHSLDWEFDPVNGRRERHLINQAWDLGAFCFRREESTGNEAARGFPNEFRILSTYPNPFNHQFVVDFYQPLAGEVTLSGWDPQGRMLFHAEGWFKSGLNSFNVNLDDAQAAGEIFIQLKNTQGSSLSRITHLK